MGFYNGKNYIGEDVNNKDVVLFSNIIRTGRTISELSRDLKNRGANNIYCYGFHGLCSIEGFDKLINELPIKELIMTNTIQHSTEVQYVICRIKK